MESEYDPTMAALGFASKSKKPKEGKSQKERAARTTEAAEEEDNEGEIGEGGFIIDQRRAERAIERETQKRKKGEASEIDDLFSSRNKKRQRTEAPVKPVAVSAKKGAQEEDLGERDLDPREEENEDEDNKDNQEEENEEMEDEEAEEEEEKMPAKPAPKAKKVSAELQNILGAIEGTKKKKKKSQKDKAAASTPAAPRPQGQKETLEEKMARIKAEQQKGAAKDKKGQKKFSMM